jgi:hypothetical protein
LSEDNCFYRRAAIDLYLGDDALPRPDLTAKTWNGYKWKSINPYK